jgi:hypothetical protein
MRVSKCEKRAHSLVRDPRRGAPLEVRELVIEHARDGFFTCAGDQVRTRRNAVKEELRNGREKGCLHVVS